MTAARYQPVLGGNPRFRFEGDGFPGGVLEPIRFGAFDLAARLETARRLLARQESRLGRSGRHQRCPTGISGFDEVLGGGVPLGVLCEMVSAGEGVGAVTLALRTARAVAGERETIFLIDPRGDFYPPAAARMGISLRQLILVRPRRWTYAAWAMEQILRCGSVGAVVGLFGLFEVRAVRRLQLAAEAGGHLGLLVHDNSRAVSARFAAVRMVVEATKPRSHEATKGYGRREARDWVSSRRMRVRLLKGRTGMSTGSVVVEIGDAADDVRVHALYGHGPGGEQRSATG